MRWHVMIDHVRRGPICHLLYSALILLLLVLYSAINITGVEAAPAQTTSVSAAQAPGLTYDRSAAYKYAMHYGAQETNDDGRYYQTHVDCAHFVSRALNAGHLDDGGQINADALARWLSSSGTARLAVQDTPPSNLQVGDVIVYSWDGGPVWDHAALVTVAAGNNSRVAEHSFHYYVTGAWDETDQPWNDWQAHAKFGFLVIQSSSKAVDDAAYVNQSPPQTVSPGQHFAISFSIANAGTTTWSDDKGYALGCTSTCMSATTKGLDGAQIHPGDQHTFQLSLTAPPSTGSYKTSWRMVQKGAPFGPYFWIGVTVASMSTDGAASAGQSGDIAAAPGQPIAVTFYKMNSGTSTWSDSAGFALTCVADCMGSHTAGFGGASVTPGQEWSFSLNLTAPSQGGTYHTSWVMEHNGRQFGDATMFVTIAVNSGGSASGSNGNTSGASPSVSCSTPSPSNPGPASYAQSTDITLAWSTNCAQSYTELSGGPYGTLNYGGWASRTSIYLGQMWPGTYTWHIKGRDGNGRETNWSDSWTFAIVATSTVSGGNTGGNTGGSSGGNTGGAPPSPTLSCSTPSLSNPGPASYAQSTDITLAWSTNCAQSYTELSGGPYGTLNYGGWASRTSVYVGQMWPGTYTWHVRGMDTNGLQTNWSASWTFTIVSAPTPVTVTPTNPPPTGAQCSTPTLTNPSNGGSYAQSTSIVIAWNTNCPQSYAELWGAPYSTMNFGGWKSATNITIGQMWPGTFSWHVMGMDSAGRQTGWSPTYTFTVQQAPVTPTNTPVPSVSCSTPTLTNPSNGGSYAQSTSIVIAWNTNCPQSYAELWGAPYSTMNFGGWKSATNITIGQMWPGTFSWHVMGMDSSGRQTSWSPTYTFTVQQIPPTNTPAPSRSTVVIDDGGSGFSLNGPGQYWYSASIGYNNHMYWTYNQYSSVSNWAQWTPSLAGGNYEVYVYIPYNNATTSNARYTIQYAGGSTQRSVNQNNYYNQWVSLGTYSFNSGSGGYVQLTDVTYETQGATKVGFDAVEFVPR